VFKIGPTYDNHIGIFGFRLVVSGLVILARRLRCEIQRKNNELGEIKRRHTQQGRRRVMGEKLPPIF
jgi:hypothetical protein